MLESFINIFTILNLCVLASLLWLKKDTSNKFLAFVVFTLATSFILNYLTFIGTIKNYPWLMVLNLGNLWPPAIAFYVRSVLKIEFKWKMIIPHLAPQIIHTIIWTSFVCKGKAYTDSIFNTIIIDQLSWKFDLLNMLFLSQSIGYLIYSTILLKDTSTPTNKTFFKKLILELTYYIKCIFKLTPQKNVKVEWLYQFIGFSFFLNVIVITLSFIIPKSQLTFVYIPVLYNIIYFIIISKSFSYSSVFASINYDKAPKYSYSPLSEIQSQEYYQQITQLLSKEKLYLNYDLRIEDLAEKLNISILFISQAINQNEGKHFLEFVNTYRINEAKRLLKNQNKTELTIETIAFDSGFGSKATFNRIFKKHAGTTPSEYIKKISANGTI